MTFNASTKRQQRKMERKAKREQKLSQKKLSETSNSDHHPRSNSPEAFTSATSTPPQYSIAMSSRKHSSAASIASVTPFTPPFPSSPTSSATSDSDTSPSTKKSRKCQLEEEKEAIKKLKREQNLMPEEKDALDNLFRWTWDAATVKPRPVSPTLGPMNEDPCYDDSPCPYEGMPREQCQQLQALGFEEEEANIFERIWRAEKEMQLDGFTFEFTPEEYFKIKLDEYLEMETKWAKAQKQYALQEMRKSARFTAWGLPLPLYLQPTLEEQVAERLRLEKKAAAAKALEKRQKAAQLNLEKKLAALKNWKWEGARSEEDFASSKWGQEDRE